VAGDIPALAESGVTGLTTDLSAKAPLAAPALTGAVTFTGTLNTITPTVFGYLSGVTSAIQTQINSKFATPGSQTQAYFFAAPCASSAAPVWRLICATDLPAATTSTQGAVQLPSGATSNVLGTAAISSSGSFAQISNNLSDLASLPAALSNLGALPVNNPAATGILTVTGSGASILFPQTASCGQTASSGIDCVIDNGGFIQVLSSASAIESTTVAPLSVSTSGMVVNGLVNGVLQVTNPNTGAAQFSNATYGSQLNSFTGASFMGGVDVNSIGSSSIPTLAGVLTSGSSTYSYASMRPESRDSGLIPVENMADEKLTGFNEAGVT
jgi:hypothetical protein